MRFDHLHHQKVQQDMQQRILTMGTGSTHMCHRHNYLTRTQFPEKHLRRLPIYLMEFAQEGVKNMLLRKRHTQHKLAALMGVSKPHCIVGLLLQPFMLIVTHSNPFLQRRTNWRCIIGHALQGSGRSHEVPGHT